ncbi:MAG: hypothetical protein AAGD38_24370 [Acidobacteriota bacterium]
MSVEELNRVHRRYIRTSNAFKSAWTYHQFVLGLRKVFTEDGPEPYSADFQSLYGTLKEVSQNLTEATYPKAADQLERVERELGRVEEMLLQADWQISPTLLRQFFQRVKNYDEGILSQLVKFYLFAQSGDWPLDRIDKVDFLVTKLNEELDGGERYVIRDRHRLREIAEGFWKSIGPLEVDETEIASLCDELDALRREVSEIDAIDELNQRNLVQRYRDLKHRLHSLFFEPRILEHIVDTNLAIKNQVQSLYQREEQRIVAEYQEVFDLEREVLVEPHLRDELADLRGAVERFEEQIQGSNVRLDELAKLRERVRALLPQLRSDADDTMSGLGSGMSADAPTQTVVIDAAEAWVEKALEKMAQAIDEVNPSLDPKKVTLAPELFSYGLEGREIVAHRRVEGRESGDREFEGFILRGAAMRVRIKEEVDEIKSILDDTAVTRDAPIFTQARTTLKHADWMMRRYEHRVAHAVMLGDISSAQELQLLRVKLMRSYAGLWLMVYR